MKQIFFNLFVKYFLPKHTLHVGEYIKDLAENKYRIEAVYYDIKLEPIIIASDVNGAMRSFPERGLERTMDEDGF